MKGSIEFLHNYEEEKRKITQQINDSEYWPVGMTHPKYYRGFYWTNDMQFCAFSTEGNKA